ncbi:hypothetical protein [Thioalkalivibrio sp. ALE28]|uniref:hypothetical protein n=1 Tax=Thioalkalivibrio sp. ALE28 TaxID=1158179 RepID=UPI00036FAC37|nr:hypothetical protein [Thioalkalivibrio sp. ALE28]
MIRAILDSLKWNARLGAKFFWAAPAATSGVVFFTLVSQLSMLLAFFLPLKVIILLGSDGIPRYFPPAFEQFDRDALIVWLSAATVAFYGLYLLAERVVDLGGERGSQTLLTRSRKMVLFENQDELAARAYKRHAEVMAGGVFLLLAVAILFWLYQSVAFIAAGYVFLVAVALLSALAVSPGFRTRLEDNLTGWMGVLSGVGFMLAFAYLVIDFLYLDPPGLIPAVIALLLSRQGFNRLSSLVSGLEKQHSQKGKIDALFFHATAFVPDQDTKKGTIWNLLEREQRAHWVPEVLAEVCGQTLADKVASLWIQTDVAGVAVLRCDVPERPGLLIKLYGHNRASLAAHEATLLAKQPRGLPAPRWLGAVELRGFACHLLEIPEGMREKQGDMAAACDELRGRLLEVAPDKNLVARYTRSRLMLWQRLDETMLARARIAANDSASEQALAALQERLENWRKHLARMPLAFTTPDIGPLNTVMTDRNEPRLLEWGRWALEPAGAGWATKPKHLKVLQEISERWGRSREDDERAATFDQMKLAACSAEFETCCARERYSQAFRLVQPIKHALDQLDLTCNRASRRE